MAEHPSERGKRLALAVEGLSLAVEGRVLDQRLEAERGVRRFLGWTKGDHWLLGKRQD